MSATKPDGSRWFAAGVIELWDHWWCCPVFRELLSRGVQLPDQSWLGPKGRQSTRGLMVINRTVPWPIPPQYAASYWDQLRTHQRFRGEVKCPGCKDSIPLTLDREPMSMGLLPSAVTLPMRCQYCCGQLAIGFCWVSWRVFALRYQPPRVCRVRRAGGEA